MRAAGIPVREFNLGGRVPNKIRSLIQLRKAIHDSDADIVHAWMYHSALFASLFAPNRRRVLIAIHHTNPFDSGLPLATRLIAFGCSLASRWSGPVVYVANSAKLMHERIGFSTLKSLIVHVGVDEASMTPATAPERTRSRQRLNVPQDAIVVAHLARYHRNKDQPTLLDAFARALTKVPELHLILVGRGLDRDNNELCRLIRHHGVQHNVQLLGEMDAPLLAFQAGDIFCLSSLTEAFPVSLVEALQCGLVPVVTDVGECRSIVGGTGFVVPSNSAQDLGDALVEASMTARSRPSDSIRAQGLKFGLSSMCEQYWDLYGKMIAISSSAA
jgi:glycosyltransferase involved in cell wall biosynthesis